MVADSVRSLDETQSAALLEGVLETTGAVFVAVPEGAGDLPTPCPGFDVAGLQRHIVGWLRGFDDAVVHGKLTIDPSAEWRQMYAEAGRIMRDHFWRPDMSGVDWDGVLERYRPVLERVATHDDLIDFHEVLAERGWFEELLDAHRRQR